MGGLASLPGDEKQWFLRGETSTGLVGISQVIEIIELIHPGMAFAKERAGSANALSLFFIL
ncbi:hypothetical protein DXT88_20035 [Herbaspirillum lusitanum]|nr:hypothetical protein [Herbaspirillum lusitanum]